MSPAKDRDDFEPRSAEMNAQTRTETLPQQHQAPLFASPWVALFLLLRKEWLEPRDRH